MKVINLIGGSGLGKSTLAAKIYAALKTQKYHVEQCIEYAKELVYQEAPYYVWNNQVKIFSEDFSKLWNYSHCNVDYVVYDSCLLTQIVYNKSEHIPTSIDNLIIDCFDLFENHVYLLKRYDEFHRNTGLDLSKEIDKKIVNVLNYYGIPFSTIDPLNPDVVDFIIKKVTK